MGNLGVVCTWIPLLLSAPSGTSVQSERAGKGDCNLSEDHPGSETGCKRIAETGRTLQQHPLPDQWGNFIWGGCTSFGGCVLRIPAGYDRDGGYGKSGYPKDRSGTADLSWNQRRSFIERNRASAGKQPSGGRGIYPQHFNRTPGTSPVEASDPIG